MKKLFAVLTVVCALGRVHACWLEAPAFDTTWIHSVNWRVVHYIFDGYVQWRNGQAADLPLTVQVMPSAVYFAGGGPGGLWSNTMVEATLQYKVIRQDGSSTGFENVGTIGNLRFSAVHTPIDLFGSRGVIDIPEGQIAAGDDIIIRIVLTDAAGRTNGPLQLDPGLEVADVPDHLDGREEGNDRCGEWRAHHVFRVKYSGKRRVRVR